MKIYRLLGIVLATFAVLAACGPREIPVAPEVPQLPVNPALPLLDDLSQLLQEFDVELLRELGLPDLNAIPNLPQIDDLPGLAVGEDAISFAGPMDIRIGVGEFIPGTDIQLAGIVDGRAEFLFNGLRTERIMGDSLDFDGAWPNITGINYTLRLRVYLVGQEYVRSAGVHRLVVEGIHPVQQVVGLTEQALKIPYTGSANVGAVLKGMTFGYAGINEQGAEISGMSAADFPFRKIGDSLRWQGMLRADLPSEFNVRIVRYSDSSLQVVGVVTLQLPV